MKVYISPSTQEKNIGALNYGTEEKRMNEIADVLCPILLGLGFEVKRNRPEMTLGEVVKDSDLYKPDIHVAIHSNAMGVPEAGKARGCEVFAYITDGTVTDSQKLARAIYDEIVSIAPTKGRGVKDGDELRFAEIIKVHATSVIVEVAFHDNIEDSKWIVENTVPIAKALAKGICKYAGVEYKEPDVQRPLSEALAVLVSEGIITTPKYWEENALTGKTVRGEYAAALIWNMAKHLKFLETGRIK